MTMTIIFKFPPFLNPPKKVSVGNASKKETKGPFNRWNWENSAWTAEEPPRQSSWTLAERDWPQLPGFFGERWGANGSGNLFFEVSKKKLSRFSAASLRKLRQSNRCSQLLICTVVRSSCQESSWGEFRSKCEWIWPTWGACVSVATWCQREILRCTYIRIFMHHVEWLIPNW